MYKFKISLSNLVRPYLRVLIKKVKENKGFSSVVLALIVLVPRWYSQN